MIVACNIANKGFNLFDYDTRATLNGFTHEVASGHATTKRGISVSAVHGSTNIIGDHADGLPNLFIGDFIITTGTFSKYLISSSNAMGDINYIEGTVLVLVTASWDGPWNIEIHDTS